MPDPLSPENAPNPPEAPELGAFSSGETGSEEHPTKPDGPPPSPDGYPKSPDNYPTSSALYPLSLDKEAGLSDNHPKPPDASQLSSDDYRTTSDAYLIPSDKEETKIGSYLFSPDKEDTKKGNEAEEKGKEENLPARSENRPVPAMRGRRTLPASPVERARLEAQGGVQQNELNDRSTQVAFALLFVVPILIILMALLLLFPFISRQMNNDDPSGVRIQPSANGQLPSR